MPRTQSSHAQEDEAAFLSDLGQRVRSIRAVRGMSRKVLAAESGISERYIAQLESGQGNVSIVLLRRVSGAMGVGVEDLVGGPVSDGSDWSLIRELIADAAPEQIARVKAILSNPKAPETTPGKFALIGLRGAGKSTLGRLAAERLGWDFVELNREIERENGLSVSEIFALYGQEGYRRFERTALKNLVDRPGPFILATGGGVVAEPLTFDMLLSSFFTVWVKARPEEHMRRVRQQGDLRPMGDDRSAMLELRTILANREPLYSRAKATVDTSEAGLEDSLGALVALLSRTAPFGVREVA